MELRAGGALDRVSVALATGLGISYISLTLQEPLAELSSNNRKLVGIDMENVGAEINARRKQMVKPAVFLSSKNVLGNIYNTHRHRMTLQGGRSHAHMLAHAEFTTSIANERSARARRRRLTSVVHSVG